MVVPSLEARRAWQSSPKVDSSVWARSEMSAVLMRYWLLLRLDLTSGTAPFSQWQSYA